MCSQPLWLWATSLPWSFSGSGEYARSKVRKAWKTHRFKACAGRADGEIGRSKIFLCKQFVAGSPVLSSLLSLVLCVFAAHAPLSLFLTAPPPFFLLTHLGFLCYGDVAINPVNAGWRVMTSEELECSCGEWGFGLVRALTGTPQLQLCSQVAVFPFWKLFHHFFSIFVKIWLKIYVCSSLKVTGYNFNLSTLQTYPSCGGCCIVKMLVQPVSSWHTVVVRLTISFC